MKHIYLYLLITGIITSCALSDNANHSPEANQPQIFERVAAAESGINFFNKIENTNAMNIFSYRNFYNGGGVAIGDINNDGWADIYMTSNLGQNKLYLNKGNFQFEDITEKAGVGGSKGWSTGVVMADVNSDGLLDIYVCNAGFKVGNQSYKTKKAQENELFINNGDNTFTESAAAFGLNENGYTTHAAFFDYDQDGDLDAYILNNSFVQPSQILYEEKRDVYDKDWELRDFLKGGGDKLLRNDGGKFVDVTEQANIHGSLIGFGLGVTVGDINGDNWLDIYVSNDFFERDYLYINQKDGTFKDEIMDRMAHQSLSSMGTDLADINNDGYPEIFATEMLPDDEYKLKTNTNFDTYNNYLIKIRRGFGHQYMHNTLQLNNQDETFSEIAFFSGVAASDWSWGALMFDADNDGFRDIYVCNGIYQDVIDQDFINFFANDERQRMALTGNKKQIDEIISKMPSNPIRNKFFRNNGNLEFTDVAAQWGMDEVSFSNGAAYGDLDNDGDLDLVVNNVNQESFLFRNNADTILKNHHISVQLKGSDKNPFAVGAKVIVHNGSDLLTAQLSPARGFQSSIDYKMIFGLGEQPQVSKIEIIWHDQSYSVIDNPTIDKLYLIDYQNIKREEIPINNTNNTDDNNKFIENIATSFATHQEDDFIDFFYEGLTMRMVSREGPCMSVGDVNGDGLDDVFVGGAAGFVAQLYIQSDGVFKAIEQPVFEQSKEFEDVASAFFDADGDGDLDIYIGSGGNHVTVNSRVLTDRLYLNDGDGNYTFSPQQEIKGGYNTGVVLPLDYDNDGDLDLFVGNRSMPQNYGVPPRSYLYQNDGKGIFKDVSDQVAPDFKTLGMITDAQFINITGDAVKELVVTGEWMSPTVFSIKNGNFIKTPTDLDKYAGWWYAIESDDIDGDGDLDLILGNRGENFYFTGSPKAPAKLWIADFDNNKDFEKIITRSVNGKDMPVVLKDELTEQIVSLKKQNLMHREYAKKSIQELFSKDILRRTIVREANYFKSAIAINQGNGNFQMKALPKEVQFSCVCDIYCTDVNGDNKKDIILGGNDYGFLPQFSRLDASFGEVLINEGNAQFSRLRSSQSGLMLQGSVRSIQPINTGNAPHFIAAFNQAAPMIFKIKR